MMVGAYGLFASMTTRRPEIIISASIDGKIWRDYSFHYKVGNRRKAPPFVAPHQPRLDWLMWFAALGSYKENIWFLHLVQKMVSPTQHQDETLRLLVNPFTKGPYCQTPNYIKAETYDYQWSTNASSPYWWNRNNNQPYLPITTRQDLANALKQFNLDARPLITPDEPLLSYHHVISQSSVRFVIFVIVLFLVLIYVPRTPPIISVQ